MILRNFKSLFVLLLISISTVSCGGENNRSADLKNSAANSAQKNSSDNNNNTEISSNSNSNSIIASDKQYTYEIVRTIPHDPAAYTQGLIYQDGILYESTGQYGSSSIRKVDAKTGKVLMKQNIPFRYFGEGIAIHDGKIYMLTWENGICYVFDAATLTQESTFQYLGEGWGLASDGDNLIMSDGTSYLRIIKPDEFKHISTIGVLDGKYPLKNLNELEYVGSELFANVWMCDSIARINPSSGALLGWLDFSALREKVKQSENAEVLNGIAYDKANGTFYITGKLWPLYFEVKLIEKK